MSASAGCTQARTLRGLVEDSRRASVRAGPRRALPGPGAAGQRGPAGRAAGAAAEGAVRAPPGRSRSPRPPRARPHRRRLGLEGGRPSRRARRRGPGPGLRRREAAPCAARLRPPRGGALGGAPRPAAGPRAGQVAPTCSTLCAICTRQGIGHSLVPAGTAIYLNVTERKSAIVRGFC